MRRPATILLILAASLFFSACSNSWQDQYIFYPGGERTAPVKASIQAFDLETEDGETLVAWYSEAAPGCPTMYYLHGAGDKIHHGYKHYDDFLQRGFGFLAISYRGYAGSTGVPSEDGFHVDGRAGWNWLSERIAPQDIVIYGYSIGSGVAVPLAAEVDEGAVVLEAPFYSMHSVARGKAWYLPTRAILNHPFRSDRHIANIGSPVFMSHGAQDEVVPIDESQRLFERAVEPKVRVTDEDANHYTQFRYGQFDDVADFLGQYWTPSDPANTNPNCKLAATPAEGAPL